MTDDQERAYTQGQKALARNVIAEMSKYLNQSHRTEAGLVAYVHDIEYQIRQLWNEVMPDPFPDDLHLGDVVKRIANTVAEWGNKE